MMFIPEHDSVEASPYMAKYKSGHGTLLILYPNKMYILYELKSTNTNWNNTKIDVTYTC